MPPLQCLSQGVRQPKFVSWPCKRLLGPPSKINNKRNYCKSSHHLRLYHNHHSNHRTRPSSVLQKIKKRFCRQNQVQKSYQRKPLTPLFTGQQQKWKQQQLDKEKQAQKAVLREQAFKLARMDLLKERLSTNQEDKNEAATMSSIIHSSSDQSSKSKKSIMDDMSEEELEKVKKKKKRSEVGFNFLF